jgi:hypothetical protein
LHDACWSGDTLVAIALIERGASVNEKDRYGQTPLHYACSNGHTATAVALIERGASVNEKDRDGWTPLHRACSNGHTVTAVALIERGASVYDTNQLGYNPLYLACIASHSATAIVLSENGTVGLNDRSSSGFTPSYWACRKCTADVVLRMIQTGAILTATDLQHFCDRPIVTEEQACTVEAAYKREDNWRRRAHYAMFLSSIRDLVDVEHEPGPSAAAALGEGGEMGNESIEAKHARLMRAVNKVLCSTDTQRLICSFL